MEKSIHDVVNDEVIVLEMTAEEIAEHEAKAAAKAEAITQAELAKAAEKAAVLTKLGLTAEELAALL